MKIHKKVNELERRVQDQVYRIDALESEIKQMQCEKHVYEYRDGGYSDGYGPIPLTIKCSKCGHVIDSTQEEFDALLLDQALDEVERLGGEVER